MNILEHNSAAWDKLADENIEWSIPVSREEIERARRGEWEIILLILSAVLRGDGAR